MKLEFAGIYEFLKEIGAIAGLGWLLKALFDSYRSRLTQPERELLVAATTGDTMIRRVNFPNIGKPWVRAGKFDLGNSPLTQAEFVEALDRLIALGYVYSLQDSLFSLTAKGMKAAKQFSTRVDLTKIPCEQNRSIPSVSAVVG